MNWQSILAGLASGASGLGDRIQQRDLLKDQQQRQQAKDALADLMANAQLRHMDAQTMSLLNRPTPPVRDPVADAAEIHRRNRLTDIGNPIAAAVSPRNIDPLSAEGIKATADRATAVAKAEQPFKPPVRDPNVIPPAQSRQVKGQQTSLLNLQRSLDAVTDYVSKHGVELLGEGRAALGALVSDAQIQYKDAANLGALTGPDLDLINSALGNPTSWTQFLRGGAQGALKSLDEVQGSLLRRAQTMENVHGVPMPPEFRRTVRPPAPAAGDTLTNPAAWLKGRRGGG